MEDKKIEIKDRAIENFLLEELLEKKLEVKSLKEENQNLSSGLNAFRGVLIEVSKRIKIESNENSTEKVISFGPISNESDKVLFETLESFAKEIGALENE